MSDLTGLDGARWLNPPEAWTQVGAGLAFATGLRTDFWRDTLYGFRRDSGHALLRRKTITPDELLAHRWLAPPLTGLGPQQVESLFDNLGGTPPLCRVSSRSTEIIYAMLAHSDMLSCAPESLVWPLLQRKDLVVLPWAAKPVGPLGVLVRSDVLASQKHPCCVFIAHVLRDAPT